MTVKNKIIDILVKHQSSVDNWSRETNACFDTEYSKIADELVKLFAMPVVKICDDQMKKITLAIEAGKIINNNCGPL
jgi:hypothetical protein